MTHPRFRSALALTPVLWGLGTLAAACDGDQAAVDAGAADLGVEDGARIDEEDAGISDAASPPPGDGGMEGLRDHLGGSCTPGPTRQGSCADADLQCVEWSLPQSMTKVSTCVRPCTASADCADEMTNRVCASVLLEQKACVSGTVGEGEVAELSLRRGGPMSGCAEPLEAFPWYVGSLLFALEDDQASCGRRCRVAGDCRTPTPFCSTGVLTSTPSGVCQVRKAAKGALCSQRSVIEMCDSSETEDVVCVNLGLTEADNRPLERELGHCLEVCTMDRPVCATRSDPRLSATCELGFFSNETLGVCDDNCTAFPDGCSGAGSDAAEGGNARGSTCVQFGAAFDAPDQALCIDIAQEGELFSAWDFMAPPAAPCADNAYRCPDRTTCTTVDLGAQQTSACVYGCDTMTGAGCEGTGFPTCGAVFGEGLRSGVCTVEAPGP